MTAGGTTAALNTDRDLLARWVGEEAVAVGNGAVADRPVHAARQRFYLDMLRGRRLADAPGRT